MLNLFAQFATDLDAENNGVWKEYGDNKFLIARAGNKPYTKLLTELVTRHKAILESKTDAAETLGDKLTIEVMAKTILLGWEEPLIVEQGGEPVPYSFDNAVKALSIKDFRALVNGWANEMDAYRVAKLEEVQKN